MRICFFIAAHNRPDMLETTFRSIHDSRHLYLIHVDEKAAADVKAVAQRLTQWENVRQIPSMSVCWGGFSQVRVELGALRAALAWDDWQYFVFMSGTDLLVRPLCDLEALLGSSGGRSFIQRLRIDSLAAPLRERIQRRSRWMHIEARGRTVRLPIPLAVLGHLASFYGSQWHFLERSFCEDVLDRIDARGIPAPLKHCLIPDEVFWQNILNDRRDIEDRIVPQNFRYAIFHGQPHPKWLTLDDIDAITRSGAYIARKFDHAISQQAIAHYFRNTGVELAAQTRSRPEH